MTQQPQLFETSIERIRCPLCAYAVHCGHYAALGPPIANGPTIDRRITCEHCQRTGTESTRVTRS